MSATDLLPDALVFGVLVLPLVRRRSYRRLLSRLRSDATARIGWYRATITLATAAVGLVAVSGALKRASPSAIGLPAFPPRTIDVRLAAWVLTFTLLSGVPAVLITRRLARRQADIGRRLAPMIGLMPISRRDRRWFVAVCLIAGCAEEVLYRGFGIAYLRALWPDITWPVLIGLTAVVFGLEHIYLGRATVVFATTAGSVLAWTTLATGTLLPAMVIHVLLDLRNLAVPGDVTERVAIYQGLAPDH